MKAFYAPVHADDLREGAQYLMQVSFLCLSNDILVYCKLLKTLMLGFILHIDIDGKPFKISLLK